MGLALLGMVGIANLVCLIMVLVRLFSEEGAGKGNLGFVWDIDTFRLGWQNANRQNIRTEMTIWTIGFVSSVVSNFAVCSEAACRRVAATGIPTGMRRRASAFRLG